MNDNVTVISGGEAAYILIRGLVIAVGVYLILSWLTGYTWRRLSKAYPAAHMPEGPRWRMASGDIRTTFHQAILNVVLGDEGLYLSTWFFRFHPPILIPWNVLAECRSDDATFMLPTERGPVRLRLIGDVERALKSRLSAVRPTPA